MICKICQKHLTKNEEWDAIRLDDKICSNCRKIRIKEYLDKKKVL